MTTHDMSGRTCLVTGATDGHGRAVAEALAGAGADVVLLGRNPEKCERTQRVIADATGHIKTRILEGTDIATPLKQTGAFPAVVGYMVAVGEQSGQLEEMLDRIADAYDEEIEVVTERATTLLEPIMIVVLATVVGFIVWAIVLPILQVGSIG